jgi:pimeloyl-ACP methyl ester carboxylesterase
VEPFVIDVDEAVLADLRARIRNTRWPEPAPGEPWSQGTDLAYLQDLLAYWADGFDWRARERELNAYPQYRVQLDDALIHFVHAKARSGSGIPLILTSGWPSTFSELLPLVPLLTDPAAHGIDGPAFDLVLPSLPGYGFSSRPRRPVNYRYVARLWHQLMRSLGYERYAAGGSDFGAGVATYLALDNPAPMIGLHLSTLEIPPYTGPGSRPLSEAEQAYQDVNDAWWRGEGAYKEVQSTKPQTLGYGLTDSPAGLAAWILEKWRSWSDPACGPLPDDELLTTVMLFWITGTITPSMRDYYDNRWHAEPLGPDDIVSVPTGIAVFSHFLADEGTPPREWAERLYDVRRWTPMPRGGHFAATEAPDLLARDIAALLASL